jgi:hypothetical protein
MKSVHFRTNVQLRYVKILYLCTGQNCINTEIDGARVFKHVLNLIDVKISS